MATTSNNVHGEPIRRHRLKCTKQLQLTCGIFAPRPGQLVAANLLCELQQSVVAMRRALALPEQRASGQCQHQAQGINTCRLTSTVMREVSMKDLLKY